MFDRFGQFFDRKRQIKKRRQHCNFDDVSELTGILDDVVAEIIIICADMFLCFLSQKVCVCVPFRALMSVECRNFF